jgi:hypothetical protein
MSAYISHEASSSGQNALADVILPEKGSWKILRGETSRTSLETSSEECSAASIHSLIQ